MADLTVVGGTSRDKGAVQGVNLYNCFWCAGSSGTCTQTSGYGVPEYTVFFTHPSANLTGWTWRLVLSNADNSAAVSLPLTFALSGFYYGTLSNISSTPSYAATAAAFPLTANFGGLGSTGSASVSIASISGQAISIGAKIQVCVSSSSGSTALLSCGTSSMVNLSKCPAATFTTLGSVAAPSSAGTGTGFNLNFTSYTTPSANEFYNIDGFVAGFNFSDFFTGVTTFIQPLNPSAYGGSTAPFQYSTPTNILPSNLGGRSMTFYVQDCISSNQTGGTGTSIDVTTPLGGGAVCQTLTSSSASVSIAASGRRVRKLL